MDIVLFIFDISCTSTDFQYIRLSIRVLRVKTTTNGVYGSRRIIKPESSHLLK